MQHWETYWPCLCQHFIPLCRPMCTKVSPEYLGSPSLKCINYAFRQFLLQYSPGVLILGKPHCHQGLQKGRGCVELCLEDTCNDPTIFVESASQASNSNSGCKPGDIQGMLLLPCMWRSSCRGVMWLKFGSRDRCRVFLRRASEWFATCR